MRHTLRTSTAAFVTQSRETFQSYVQPQDRVDEPCLGQKYHRDPWDLDVVMVDLDVSNFQISPTQVSVGTPVMLEIRSTTLLDPRTKVVRVLDSRLLTESREPSGKARKVRPGYRKISFPRHKRLLSD